MSLTFEWDSEKARLNHKVHGVTTSVPNMKNRKAKTASEPHPDDMLPEYDFSKSRRNPYAAAFEAGTVAVVLDADVAKRFPDAKAVNEALRGLK